MDHHNLYFDPCTIEYQIDMFILIFHLSCFFQMNKTHLTTDQLICIASFAKDKTVLWDTISTKGSGKYHGGTFPEEMKALAEHMGWTGQSHYLFSMCYCCNCHCSPCVCQLYPMHLLFQKG